MRTWSLGVALGYWLSAGVLAQEGLTEVERLQGELHKLKVELATREYELETRNADLARQLADAKGRLNQCTLQVERGTLETTFRDRLQPDEGAAFDWTTMDFLAVPEDPASPSDGRTDSLDDHPQPPHD